MSAPKLSGPQETAARVAIGPGEVRIVLYRDAAAGLVDLRWFEPFAGPAQALTPTKTGLTIPVEDLGEIIQGLQVAEKLARQSPQGGGQ
jgi:hypothetical protein